MAVGDNIQGDILSAYKARIEHLVWVDKKGGWSPYRQGELPKGTRTIANLGELMPLMIEEVGQPVSLDKT